jgi:SWI/SNF-related matrix-associated actin-dependent regulator of chromatin subfamily A-like protein 1
VCQKEGWPQVIVTFWKGIFVVDKPEDRSVLTKAGFEPHEPSLCTPDKRCKACYARIGNRWWSNRVESATRLRSYCNQLALAAIKTHVDKLAKSRAVTSDILVPAPQGLKYAPYQLAGIAFIRDHKDTLLGDDMGLGKTVQALGFVNYIRYSSNEPLSILVVCPSTLRFNWRQEIERWLVKPMTVIIPTGPKFEVPRQDNIVVITNYEKLIGVNPFTESLKRVWDVLVCDEAQALKTYNTKRSQAILGREGLLQRAHRFLALTGTPIENYPKEIWPLAAAICPAKFGDRIAFLKRYCALHDEKRGGRVVSVDTGATNLGELQQRLRASFMLRRLKNDVLKELPPKRRQLVTLNDAQADWSRDPDFRRWRELYERDYEAKLAALEAAKTQVEYRLAVRALDEFTGVAFQEMSDFRHRTALAKLPACIEYIDDMLTAGLDKLVIFAHHQDVLAKLAEHYGDQAVSLHGATRQQDREKVVRAFQEGDKKIFIGGLKAAGIGLNLYAASTVVFIEIDWNPAVLSQAEDRLCRMGQKKMVHVIHLVLDGTLDVNICKRVVAKQEVIDKALNRLPDHGLKLQNSVAYQPGTGL